MVQYHPCGKCEICFDFCRCPKPPVAAPLPGQEIPDKTPDPGKTDKKPDHEKDTAKD